MYPPMDMVSSNGILIILYTPPLLHTRSPTCSIDLFSRLDFSNESTRMIIIYIFNLINIIY